MRDSDKLSIVCCLGSSFEVFQRGWTSGQSGNSYKGGMNDSMYGGVDGVDVCILGDHVCRIY